MAYAGNCIKKDPAAEPENMHPNKRHAAAEIRDLLGQTIRGRPLFSGRIFESDYGFDILLCQLLDRLVRR